MDEFMEAVADFGQSREIPVSFIRDPREGWLAVVKVSKDASFRVLPIYRKKTGKDKEELAAYEKRVRAELTTQCARVRQARIAEYTGAGEALVGRGVRPIQAHVNA
jgi:hypothetical protein